MGSGNINETTKSMKLLMRELRDLKHMKESQVFSFLKKIKAPYDMVVQTKMGRLPIVHFAAGGIMTPMDAALMMHLRCRGVFVGSETFDCEDPFQRGRRIIQAVMYYNNAHVLVECSYGIIVN
ncbi:Pyridoxal 5'-phosphate synthase subunit PDX1.2 [Spatholobus suberectus]|nr:Pyridoxal 5'-phosphate synthase subunit PDX1.2 [Spatholobus suberectus]